MAVPKARPEPKRAFRLFFTALIITFIFLVKLHGARRLSITFIIIVPLEECLILLVPQEHSILMKLGFIVYHPEVNTIGLFIVIIVSALTRDERCYHRFVPQ